MVPGAIVGLRRNAQQLGEDLVDVHELDAGELVAGFPLEICQNIILICSFSSFMFLELDVAGIFQILKSFVKTN